MTWYVRDPEVVALSRGGSYVFVRAGLGPLLLEEVDVTALAIVLAGTAMPIEETALLELCDQGTIDLLVDHAVLRRGSADEVGAAGADSAPARQRPCRRMVLGLTGSSVVLTALPLVRAIATQVADEVDIVLTRGARRLVPPRTFEYPGHRTWTDAFAPRAGAGVPHMHLATTADLVLIAPASAGAIARLASGSCSDLLSLVVAATRAPVVVAPAMNEAMWRNPAVARNVERLRADGMWIVEPRVGREIGDRDHPGMMGGMGIDHASVTRVLRVVLDQHRADA